MKTATLPALRVTPKLRDELESVLQEGESLSAFIEAAVRDRVDWRRTQLDFIAAGLAEEERARKENDYVSAEEVIAGMDAIISRVSKRKKKQQQNRKRAGKRR